MHGTFLFLVKYISGSGSAIFSLERVFKMNVLNKLVPPGISDTALRCMDSNSSDFGNIRVLDLSYPSVSLTPVTSQGCLPGWYGEVCFQ